MQEGGYEDHDEAESAKQDDYFPEKAPQEDDTHLCGLVNNGHRKKQRKYPQQTLDIHPDVFR